eukprot:2152445-Karenia_brevis.AAC.1
MAHTLSSNGATVPDAASQGEIPPPCGVGSAWVKCCTCGLMKDPAVCKQVFKTSHKCKQCSALDGRLSRLPAADKTLVQ